MKKVFVLIKASMNDGMNLFKINTKKKNNFTVIVLPIILSLIIMGVIYSYAEMMIQSLKPYNMEFVELTLFILVTFIMTLIEGIYKSSGLLFNCKDDNLLLSLPVGRSIVLFIRVFKFYVFELLYNSLFLIPAIVAYAIHMKPNIIYYIVSVIGLLIFPIVPILFSCIIGTFISFVTSKFKGKNYIQTILVVILLLGVMYFSYNSEGLITDIAQKAESINDVITKVYYPAGKYIELIGDFNILGLLEFIGIHAILFIITIILIGKVYFNVNSKVKTIRINKKSKDYIIKTSSPIKSLIKKEFNRFINSTVFITNAGFGLVLFVLGCILFIVKFDGVANEIIENMPGMTLDRINDSIPVILLGFICFASFMTSITSSMISLEGKSFNILKSLPLKPYTIVKAKVLTAVLIMIPCILVGNIIVFIKFKFDLLNIFLILVASVLFPFISATIGILVNLKYPRMDAENDTEVVKQSMSSGVSVFIGILLFAITISLLFCALSLNIPYNIIITAFIAFYGIIYLGLSVLLHKTCEKSFNNIVI